MSTEASVSAIEAVMNSRNLERTDGDRQPSDQGGVLRGDPEQGRALEGNPELSHANNQNAPTEQQPEAEQTPEMVPSARLKQEADRRRNAEGALNEERSRIRALENQLAEMSGALQALTAQESGLDDDDSSVLALDDETIENMMVEQPALYHRHIQELFMDVLERRTQQIAAEFGNELKRAKFVFSDRLAVARHGQQVVTQATNAAVNAGHKDYFLAQDDPVGACIDWWRAEHEKAKYGATPEEAYQRALRDVQSNPNLANPNGTTPQQPRQNAQPQMNPPPSFSGMPRGATSEPVHTNALSGLLDVVKRGAREHRGVATRQ
jgi:hypothetical protein